MAVVKELIRKESNGTISFGDYELDKKTKLENFEVSGDVYKVKTFNEITKLERNEAFVYESIPGTAVNLFSASEKEVNFYVDGIGQTQVTLELEPTKEYHVYVGEKDLGVSKTATGGKLTIDVELEKSILTHVKVVAE